MGGQIMWGRFFERGLGSVTNTPGSLRSCPSCDAQIRYDNFEISYICACFVLGLSLMSGAVSRHGVDNSRLCMMQCTYENYGHFDISISRKLSRPHKASLSALGHRAGCADCGEDARAAALLIARLLEEPSHRSPTGNLLEPMLSFDFRGPCEEIANIAVPCWPPPPHLSAAALAPVVDSLFFLGFDVKDSFFGRSSAARKVVFCRASSGMIPFPIIVLSVH